MSRRSWVAMCTAVMVAFTATATIVVPRTGWMHPRAQHRPVPTCEQAVGWPTVDAALQATFSTTWDQRERSFSDLDDSSLCAIRAQSLFFDEERHEPGTPRWRSLSAHWFPEDLRWFRETGRWMCQTSSTATGFADEAGLGDEAFSCWTSAEVGRYRTLDRRLHFRAGGISFWIELSGADYGPQSDTADIPRLRNDLERNARCIAEALAIRVDAPVSRRICGGTARDM